MEQVYKLKYRVKLFRSYIQNINVNPDLIMNIAGTIVISILTAREINVVKLFYKKTIHLFI